ncbi:MAG: class I SAM-dependent methyltransferase [Leptospiraceae bacterium]|nr:class I SAM-dependent methyltransferase [Leptospiraceae bacterium]
MTENQRPPASAAPPPDHTALRVALWRALHTLVDPDPVFRDLIGAQLIDEPDWRSRPDMDLQFSRPMRASIAGRSRFIEDLLESQIHQGVSQYVLLGAGLDTCAQRRPDLAAKLQIFEIDQADTLRWKEARLSAIGHPPPANLHFIGLDFESNPDWLRALSEAGLQLDQPAFFVSSGVSMYLSKSANAETLQTIARCAAGSTLAMTFLLALDELEGEERALMEFVMQRAAESHTPFQSLFTPAEMDDLARQAGFKTTELVSAATLYDRYFAGRSDHLRAGHAEAFIVASNGSPRVKLQPAESGCP